jgi:hypothetical protein
VNDILHVWLVTIFLESTPDEERALGWLPGDHKSQIGFLVRGKLTPHLIAALVLGAVITSSKTAIYAASN